MVNLLYVYVVTTIDKNYQPCIKAPDHGMSGPNIIDDLITLGTCKRIIRKKIKKIFNKYDIFIVGFSRSPMIPRRALFILKVDEVITFNEAWNRGEINEVFRLKRGGFSPLTDETSRIKMNGDIIVKSDDGIHYKHIGGVHRRDWNRKILPSGLVGSEDDAYLIGDSNISRYLGEKGPVLTKNMLQQYWKGYPNAMRGHRVLKGKNARRFLQEYEFI